jgi:hypothetical protein
MPEFKFDVAGVVVSITCQSQFLDRHWFVDFSTSADQDINIRIHQGEDLLLLDDPRFLTKPQDNGWVFRRHTEGYVGIYADRTQLVSPMVVRISENATAFDFHILTLEGRDRFRLGREYVMPLMLALSTRKGLLLHSAGIKTPGGGILFSGPSGVGKTTMAKLWIDADAGSILNDDVCAVRQMGGEFIAYGTPWIGSGQLSSVQQAPLRGIFFLEHGTTNSYRSLGKAQALTLILSQSFLPRWDAPRTEYILDTCTSLADQVPCYHLVFEPTDDVVDLLQSFLGLR